MLNQKWFQASKPEMEFNIINMMYAALPRRAQTEKTTFSCKDDCILTKHTWRWTYSPLRLQYDLCRTSLMVPSPMLCSLSSVCLTLSTKSSVLLIPRHVSVIQVPVKITVKAWLPKLPKLNYPVSNFCEYLVGKWDRDTCALVILIISQIFVKLRFNSYKYALD